MGGRSPPSPNMRLTPFSHGGQCHRTRASNPPRGGAKPPLPLPPTHSLPQFLLPHIAHRVTPRPPLHEPKPLGRAFLHFRFPPRSHRVPTPPQTPPSASDPLTPSGSPAREDPLQSLAPLSPPFRGSPPHPGTPPPVPLQFSPHIVVDRVCSASCLPAELRVHTWDSQCPPRRGQVQTGF